MDESRELTHDENVRAKALELAILDYSRNADFSVTMRAKEYETYIKTGEYQ